MQRIDLPDAKAANTQALDDLSNGATALTLVFEGAVGDYGYALPATGAAISQALDNVYLDAGIAIELDLSRAAKALAGFSRLWSRLAASPRSREHPLWLRSPGRLRHDRGGSGAMAGDCAHFAGGDR